MGGGYSESLSFAIGGITSYAEVGKNGINGQSLEFRIITLLNYAKAQK